MAFKHGYVDAETTPPTKVARIRRFRLDNGKQVFLPAELAATLMPDGPPPVRLYCIERGILGRTDWAGTLPEVRAALRNGRVKERDLGGFRLPDGPAWFGGDYGPNSPAVEQILAALERLDRAEWANLVSVNDGAGRGHPPELTSDSDYRRALGAASEAASMIAMTAVGPKAAEAWRAEAITSLAHSGGPESPERGERWRLADLAWRHQFAAQHAVLSVATANADRWALYEPLLSHLLSREFPKA